MQGYILEAGGKTEYEQLDFAYRTGQSYRLDPNFMVRQGRIADMQIMSDEDVPHAILVHIQFLHGALIHARFRDMI